MSVFRHTTATFPGLRRFLQGLVGNVTYKQPGLREEAPKFADCLTIIWYIYQKVAKVNIPITRIGNMPRELFSLSQWRFLCVDHPSLRKGDLLFLKCIERTRLISHVVIFAGNDLVFHCNLASKTAQMETVEKCLSRYRQLLRGVPMLRFIDPRDKELLRKNKGEAFLTD